MLDSITDSVDMNLRKLQDTEGKYTEEKGASPSGCRYYTKVE